MRFKPVHSRRRRRGSILLMVLVLIVVVSYVLTRFIERAQVEVQGEGYYVERTRLRLQAWSMMEVAVATLADVLAIDGALFAPAQGWGDPLEYTGVEVPEGLSVRYEFVDESAKMNINEIDEGSLFLLFDGMEFDISQSQKLTNVLLDWIDEDDETRIDGAESREYSTPNQAMLAANRPIRSLRELSALVEYRALFFDEEGVPNERFTQLASVVSALPNNQLNVNSASGLALKTLAGLNDIQIEMLTEYLAGFDGEIGTTDDNYFASTGELGDVIGETAATVPLATAIGLMTVRVTVQEGGSAFTLIGTISTQDQASGDSEEDLQYPFLFLEVTEEPGLNNASSSSS